MSTDLLYSYARKSKLLASENVAPRGPSTSERTSRAAAAAAFNSSFNKQDEIRPAVGAATPATQSRNRQRSNQKENSQRQKLTSCLYPIAMSAQTLKSLNIELLVLDMAGTTVDEDGLVYRQLLKAMVEAGGLKHLTMHDLHPWHGAQKVEVMRHFVRRDWDKINGSASSSGSDEEKEALVQKVILAFEAGIRDGYFGPKT